METSWNFDYETDIHNHIWLYEMVKAPLQDDSVQYNFVFSNTLINSICLNIEVKIISNLGFAT